MMSGRGGQLFMVGIMLFVMIFITAIVMIEPIKESVALARLPSNLDCDNTSISTGQKMTCIINDWMLPLFFGTAVGVGFGFIGMRTLVQQQ